MVLKEVKMRVGRKLEMELERELEMGVERTLEKQQSGLFDQDQDKLSPDTLEGKTHEFFSCRYCLLVKESPSGGTTGGKSSGEGVQSSHPSLRMAMVFSVPLQSSLMKQLPGCEEMKRRWWSFLIPLKGLDLKKDGKYSAQL